MILAANIDGFIVMREIIDRKEGNKESALPACFKIVDYGLVPK